MSLPHGGLKGRKVDLLHRPLVGIGRVGHAIDLLVVQCVVLDRGDDVLALDSLDLGHCGLAGQIRVFAVVFEVAAVQRAARDVDTRRELDVDALLPCLPPDLCSDRIFRIAIPARGLRDAVGKRGRAGLPVADTCTCVVEHQLGDAQRGHGRDVVSGAVVAEVATAVELGNLLVERHRLDELVAALIR